MAARATDVGTRATPLLGMPSTASDGTIVHHPGPLELWAVGLGRHLADVPWAPLAVIVLVNLLSLGAIVWFARQLATPTAAWVAIGGTALLTWSVRGEILASPFNPYAAVLPFAAFLVAAVASTDRVPGAVLAAIVTGSWAAQAHLTFVLPIVAVALTVTVWRWRFWRHDEGQARHRRGAAVVAVVTLLLWSGPLLDVVLHQGGNVVALLDRDGQPPLGLRGAVDVITNALVPVPAFARPDADLFVLFSAPPAWKYLLAGLLIAATARAAWQRRWTVRGALAAVGLAATLGGLITLASLPDLTFNTLALHNYLWLWPTGAVLWACVVLDVGSAVSGRFASYDGSGARRVAVGLAVAASAIACLPATRPDADWERAGTRRAVAAALPVLEQGQRYAVEVDADFTVFAVQVGVAHDLERRGFEIVVPGTIAEGWGRRTSGPADHEILIRSIEEPLRPPPIGLEPIAIVAVPDRGDFAIYVREVQA